MEMILARASTFAESIDFVIVLIFGFTFAWLVAAEVVLFSFIFKYRRKDGKKAAYITGEKHEEAKWIHWPHYLVIACDLVIIYFAVSTWYEVKQKLPPADATIRIVGQQWAWTFTHPGADRQLGTPDDIITVDELHVSTGVTYHFKLEAKDVLHSFSVPAFRLKQDAVPGRVITGWFKPTRAGQYDIQCAEICGVGHGIMVAKLHIEEPTEHARWIASRGTQVAEAR